MLFPFFIHGLASCLLLVIAHTQCHRHEHQQRRSPELPVTANVGIKLQIDEEIRVKPQCKFNAMLGEGLAIYVVFGFNCDLSRYALNCSKFIPLMSLEILVLISLKILTVSNSFTILFFVFIIHNFFW